MNESVFNAFFITCVSLSIVSEFLLIFAFIKLEQIRKYPGQFILIQTIFQLFLDIHWLSGLGSLHLSLHKQICKLIGALTTCCVFHAWTFNFFISLEVYKKLIQPKSTRKTRFYLYFISTILFTITILLCLLVSDQTGISLFNTCSIEAGSPYQLINLFMVVFVTLSCAYMSALCVYVGKGNKKLNGFLKYHIFVIAGFIVTLGPAATLDGLSYKLIDLADNGAETLVQVFTI